MLDRQVSPRQGVCRLHHLEYLSQVDQPATAFSLRGDFVRLNAQDSFRHRMFTLYTFRDKRTFTPERQKNLYTPVARGGRVEAKPSIAKIDVALGLGMSTSGIHGSLQAGRNGCVQLFTQHRGHFSDLCHSCHEVLPGGLYSAGINPAVYYT